MARFAGLSQTCKPLDTEHLFLRLFDLAYILGYKQIAHPNKPNLDVLPPRALHHCCSPCSPSSR